MRRSDGKAPVDQMSGEFGLRVLICILAIEICCPYKGAFLRSTSVCQVYHSGFSLAGRTLADGLYHASNEVAVVTDPILSDLYR